MTTGVLILLTLAAAVLGIVGVAWSDMDDQATRRANAAILVLGVTALICLA